MIRLLKKDIHEVEECCCDDKYCIEDYGTPMVKTEKLREVLQDWMKWNNEMTGKWRVSPSEINTEIKERFEVVFK